MMSDEVIYLLARVLGFLAGAVAFCFPGIVCYVYALIKNNRTGLVIGSALYGCLFMGAIYGGGLDFETIAIFVLFLIFTIFTYIKISKGQKIDVDNDNSVILSKNVVCSVDEELQQKTKQHETNFQTIIYDASNGTVRKEKRYIDTKKFPIARFAEDNTYYAIENIKDGKKTRIFYTKERWHERIEELTNQVE